MSQPDLAIDRRWYKHQSEQDPPFTLFKKISSNNPNAPPFRTIAFFPWANDSLQTLWQGSLNTPELLLEWKVMISQFQDAVAVGGTRAVYIFLTQASQNPICVSLPEDRGAFSKDPPDLKILPTDVLNVAWTLNPHFHLEPLLIFSHASLLYIYNVKRKGISTYLRGHGGSITSIAVHPITTNLFCTTSRDYSTRIYDLNLLPEEGVANPHWPPSMGGSRAGAAHGLHMTEPEGSGRGRCIIVLMGGRSGGHQAAVLGAAFHPHLPIIATCGLDRLVKIWPIRMASKTMLTREDKPLFSSGRIHKARVLSVTWLLPDLLATHSAPALMRMHVNDPESKETYLEPGQFIVWRWLGIDRFFPPTRQDIQQDVLRGCASDYQESASFKIISTLSFPKVPTQNITPILHIYQSPCHDPIVLFTYPNSTLISIFNIVHLQPRKPPPFPFDEAGLVDVARRMRLDATGNGVELRNIDAPPEVSGWEIRITPSDESEKLMACAMGMNGKIILSVGTRGSIWIWKQRSPAGDDTSSTLV